MTMEILTNKGSVGGTVKRATKEEIEKLRKEANRMVKGIFRCHEPRGGSVQLVWREFKGDPIRRWTLVDGHEYELPIGLARHLNNNCSYAVHQHILGADGKPAVDKMGKKISRMNFESIEYYG